jgi:uncharacterized protein
MAVFINQNLYPGEFLLHKKYAATEMLLDLIWTHSNIIADIALHLLDTYDFDKTELQREYVLQASLLHEIGVYMCGGFEWIPNQPPSQYPYIQHGIIGAWILQQEGYSPKIVQVAHCHIGVGLSAEDIRSHAIELPQQDFFPQTPLQKFMTYVSKFHSKTPKFRTNEQIKESLRRFSDEKMKAFEELEKTYGIPNIPQFEQKYDEWHKGFIFRAQQMGKIINTAPLSTSGAMI